MSALRLILWDQLSFEISSLKNVDKKKDTLVFLETIFETTYVNHHIKKLAFLLSAMRHFAKELEQRGFNVFYVQLSDEEASLTSGIKRILKTIRVDEIIVTEPGEYRVLKEIHSWSKKFKTPVNVLPDTRFFCSLHNFNLWAKGKKRLRMENFYRNLRKETGLLMDTRGLPMGGKWNFDAQNRNPLHQVVDFPAPFVVKPDEITLKVLYEIEERFPKNFGNLHPFGFAVDRKGAEKAFEYFLNSSLADFGPYQDAMRSGEPILYHSGISHYLNAGLLDPKKICFAVQEAFLAKKIPLQSAEGYIRQILGWREYVRGVYWLKMPSYSKMNFFNAQRKLPWLYWSGKTPMNCMKEAIQQTKQNAYSHHIQRLMITGNFALLAGILPEEVCYWYLSVYADAHEWVELPNTLGMSQFADGGFLASKPYISSGSYINKMSNFCKECCFDVSLKEGDKACPFNYLYWNFLLKHRALLKKNPRLSLAYKNLDKMPAAKKKKIQEDSKRFLEALPTTSF